MGEEYGWVTSKPGRVSFSTVATARHPAELRGSERVDVSRCGASLQPVWLSLALYSTNLHIIGMWISTEVEHIILRAESAEGRVGRGMGTRTRLTQLHKAWKWKQSHHNSNWSKRSVDKHINRVKGSKVTWGKNKQQDRDEWMESNLLLF